MSCSSEDYRFRAGSEERTNEEAVMRAQALEGAGAAYVSATTLTYATFPLEERYSSP